MPEKIKTLYGSLIEEGYDLPNYDQFLKDMSDNNKRTKFHASLVEEGYELPDFKTFSLDMGFDEKKKGFSDRFGEGLREYFWRFLSEISGYTISREYTYDEDGSKTTIVTFKRK